MHRMIRMVAASALCAAVLGAGAPPVGADGEPLEAPTDPGPATSHPACPPELLESAFFDVDPASVHATAIDCVALWEITTGRDDGGFGPALEVTRGQLATFLMRAAELADQSRLPEAPPDAFTDDDGHPHELGINVLAAVQVFEGVDGGLAAPDRPVTRAQAASLVARTLAFLLDVAELPAGDDRFADDQGSRHEPAINALAGLGIIQGTTATSFTPDLALNRSQTASIIVGSLDHLVNEGLLNPAILTFIPPIVCEVVRTFLFGQPFPEGQRAVLDAMLTSLFEGSVVPFTDGPVALDEPLDIIVADETGTSFSRFRIMPDRQVVGPDPVDIATDLRTDPAYWLDIGNHDLIVWADPELTEGLCLIYPDGTYY